MSAKFIHVGNDSALISALHKVYGSHLCEAALCSDKSGKARLAACDKWDQAAHAGVKSKAHKLPKVSGPSDVENWAVVQKATKSARRSAKKE